MVSPAQLKARRDQAKKERNSFQPLLDEAFKYAIPFRKSTRHTTTGANRVDDVFDHTAIDSAFRFAGKYQQDIWPPGQQNFSLEPGPIVIDQATRDQMSRQLAGISAVLQSFFDDGSFDLALHEIALDLSAGTGALFMPVSDDATELWDPMSVAIDELLFEAGPNGKICGIFWTRKMPRRVALETWPDGAFSPDMLQRMQSEPEGEIELHCDTIQVKADKRGGRAYWAHIVWMKEDEPSIYQSQTRTCPWATPRYYRVPGETYGRGLVMLAMPTIKTVNTTARLQLMAAAIAMLGIYTARDDGVFNPDLSPLEPGVFWKVGANAGPMGPSVSKFPDPRLDLSNMVISSMQSGIRGTMMDQDIPADNAAVKSATEIMERVKRGASDHLGAYGRSIKELVIPVVKRVMEIAYNRALIPHEIPLDQLLVRVRVKSPLAIAREAARVEKILQWLQMVLSISAALGSPAGATRIAKIEQALVEIGKDLGVDPRFIVTDAERAAMDKQDAQQAAAKTVLQAATNGAVTGQDVGPNAPGAPDIPQLTS